MFVYYGHGYADELGILRFDGLECGFSFKERKQKNDKSFHPIPAVNTQTQFSFMMLVVAILKCIYILYIVVDELFRIKDDMRFNGRAVSEIAFDPNRNERKQIKK